MLNSLFSNVTSNLDLLSFGICTLVAIISGFFIALTHKYTSKYSKGYLTTISLLPFLVQIVITLVNGNLGTGIAIMGAFSLVKFRSIPGTAKEILSVFFAMTVGLAVGTGFVGIACLITIVGCLFLLLYNKITLFEKDSREKMLKIEIPEDLDYTGVFQEEFDKYTTKANLVKSKTIDMGSMYELTYIVTLKDIKEEKKFIDDLRVKNGNLKIMISQSMEEWNL